MSVFTGATGKLGSRRLCNNCKQPVRVIDENLLKTSVRVLSSLAVSLPAPLNNQNQTCEDCGQQPPSTQIKMPVIERNENLHNCKARHTNSRKREYKRWDIPHSELVTRYRPQPIITQHMSDDNTLPINERTATEDSSCDDQTWNSLHEMEDDNATELDDEELDDTERLQLNFVKIKKQNSAAMLREIQIIKEKHKTLAELNLSRNKVRGEEKPSYRYETVAAEVDSAKRSLRRLKKHQHLFEKDEKFQQFREKTTVKLNRNFRKPVFNDDQVGVLYVQKEPTHPSLHKNKSNSLHPVSDAIQKIKPKPFKTLNPGDMQPSVYFPVLCEAKTAVESALRLDKFMKYLELETPQYSLISGTRA